MMCLDFLCVFELCLRCHCPEQVGVVHNKIVKTKFYTQEWCAKEEGQDSSVQFYSILKIVAIVHLTINQAV